VSPRMGTKLNMPPVRLAASPASDPRMPPAMRDPELRDLPCEQPSVEVLSTLRTPRRSPPNCACAGTAATAIASVAALSATVLKWYLTIERSLRAASSCAQRIPYPLSPVSPRGFEKNPANSQG